MDNFNILVCDDEKSIVEAIEIYLKQENYNVIKAYNGEILLVCSDGLTNFVEDNEIFEGMKKEGTLSERLSGLTELANSRGGRDNISIVALGMED